MDALDEVRKDRWRVAYEKATKKICSLRTCVKSTDRMTVKNDAKFAEAIALRELEGYSVKEIS